MVTLEQVKTGLFKYIDLDIMPHLDGFKKIGFGAYTLMASENAVAMALQFKDHPAVTVTGAMDKSGNVDIDKLYQSVAPYFANGERQTIKIPLIGNLTVDKTDLEKLYSYIKEA